VRGGRRSPGARERARERERERAGHDEGYDERPLRHRGANPGLHRWAKSGRFLVSTSATRLGCRAWKFQDSKLKGGKVNKKGWFLTCILLFL
jgi:hypothetical protein